MKLTPAMKREILSYVMQYTKGIIEDNVSCPATSDAFFAEQITSGQVEEFIDEAREKVLATLDEVGA